ncbi:LysR substrate-binding domain-containing protein [Variovorax sp. WS11]|uniref:LysR substrate-binding domain-containing protein n=1 Tax=Variovorax sp. WS11 TaxID=1105204 RepID=UPI001EF19D01|nr:LysR substrate-binding domain-containing protein [Variovorax sp. WS11]
MRSDEEVKELQQEPLVEDRISVIARSGQPLARAARRAQHRLRRAASGELGASRPGSPSRELLERFFSEAKQAAPVPAVETGDLAVLRSLLLESDMLTAISAH